MPVRLGSPSDGRALGAAVLVFGLLSAGASTLRAQGAGSGHLEIREPHSRFDDRYQFETVGRTFELSKSGTAPVRITQAIALDGTGRISVDPMLLPPGGGARIEVQQPLGDRLGEVAFRYALLTDEPGADRYRFSLSGFVQSAFDPERPRFEFGNLDRARGGRAEIGLASREVDRLRILSVEEAPPFLQLSWSEPGGPEGQVDLVATLAPGAPQGLLAGSVRLRTNVPSQPLVAVQYVAQVFGDVVPSRNPVPLGAIRIGESAVAVVHFESRSGRLFSLAPAAPEGAKSPLELAFRDCAGAAPSAACRELEVRFTPLVPGPISGIIELRVAGDSAPLPLIYTGLAILPDTVIQQLPGFEPEKAAPPAEHRP